MCIPSRIGGCDAALCFSINTIGLQVGCVCQRTTMGPTAVTYMFSGKHAYIPIYIYAYAYMYVCVYIYTCIYNCVYIYMITQIGVICGYISHTCLCLFPQIQCIDPHKQPWGCFSIIWNIHLVFLCMGSNGVVGSNLLDCGSINDVVAILFWRKGFYAYSRLECPQRLSK